MPNVFTTCHAASCECMGQGHHAARAPRTRPLTPSCRTCGSWQHGVNHMGLCTSCDGGTVSAVEIVRFK